MEVIISVIILSTWLALIVVPLNIGAEQYKCEEDSEEATDTHFMRG